MQCMYCTFVMADPPGPTCPNCGNSTMPPGYVLGPAREPAGLSELSVAVSILFGCVALAQALDAMAGSSGHAKDVLDVLSGIAIITLIPVFLVWFYKARRNAGLWGPQRHGQGWSIGAWFTPVVCLWFPYQILSDIWRASEPPPATARARRQGPDAAAIGWWACWILAWATGISFPHSTTTLPDGTTSETSGFHTQLGGTVVSNVFTALAALLAVRVVITVTRMQEARRQPPR